MGVVAEVELDPVDPAGEGAAGCGVFVADWGPVVGADVEGFVEREDHRDGGLDSPAADPAAVDVEIGRAALAEPAAVVAELQADLVVTGRKGVVGAYGESAQAEQVVAVGRPALVDVEAPAAEGAALGDDHTVGSRIRAR